MENKHVGYLVLGMAVLFIIVIFLFQSALKEVVKSSCIGEHALSCPMYEGINKQTYLSLGLVGMVIIVGLIFIFTKPQERVVVRKIKDAPKKPVNIADLRKEDRMVYDLIRQEGASFQAHLIEKTGLGKSKISRIIDRLEGRGLVERIRRGMTNVVVRKE